MAVKKYSGENVLAYLMTLIKRDMVAKVLKTGSSSVYKTLSDNDLTDALKGNYDAAYAHSTSAHAPSGAQANVIEAVKVNGTALGVTAKAVDVPVPLISTNIATDSGSDLKTASPKAVASYVNAALAGITGISFRVLETGEYSPTTGLPTVQGNAGVIYLVPADGAAPNIYKEFIYINSAFELIGTTAVDLTGYLQTADLVEFTNAEIDALWAAS